MNAPSTGLLKYASMTFKSILCILCEPLLLLFEELNLVVRHPLNCAAVILSVFGGSHFEIVFALVRHVSIWRVVTDVVGLIHRVLLHGYFGSIQLTVQDFASFENVCGGS